MANFLIVELDKERESRFGIPHVNARYYHWKDNLDNLDNYGYARAITEMEALDRIREAFPDAGSLKWISYEEFRLARETQEYITKN